MIKFHKIPRDLSKALISDNKAVYNWEKLTPLARNEWICWVISVKKESTRQAHIFRLLKEIRIGKKRPCCWYGCQHRN